MSSCREGAASYFLAQNLPSLWASHAFFDGAARYHECASPPPAQSLRPLRQIGFILFDPTVSQKIRALIFIFDLFAPILCHEFSRLCDTARAW